MIRSTWKLAALAAVVAVGSVSMYTRAADEAKPAAAAESKAEAKEADDEKAQAKKPARLVKPWSQLTLTEAQANKIREIHAKALAETKAIEERERADVMALLSDAQKAELTALAEAEAAARKAAAASAPKKAPAAKESEAKPASGKAP